MILRVERKETKNYDNTTDEKFIESFRFFYLKLNN